MGALALSTLTILVTAFAQERIAGLAKLVCDGVPIGVLGYADDEAVAWCSIAPRDRYEALIRSRTLPPIDEKPVWSVVCFFVDRHFRRQGVMLGLLNAAVDYARSMGAPVVEGYPVDPGSTSYTYMGSPGTFRRAGFRDVTPAGQTRIVMRIQL